MVALSNEDLQAGQALDALGGRNATSLASQAWGGVFLVASSPQKVTAESH